MSDEKQIITQIEAYIHQGGGEYGDWFVGLADNPIDPIMEVTRLNEVQNHRFTYIETASHHIARTVADYFINTCGTNGNIREIETCCSLYVYKKAERLDVRGSALPVQGIKNRSANLSSQGSLST
jgi:hypothetical protein